MDTDFEQIVGEEHERFRLDVFLAEVVEDATRSFLKTLIKDGRVTINGRVCTRPSRTVAVGDRIVASLPPAPETAPSPEDIPLDILYEDGDLLFINKPSGLIVHPAPGHPNGTLVNAVLFHCPDFQCAGEDLARPGIVHRLDKYTSGVLVVAKTQRAFISLARQAREHAFDRRYLALVRGEFKEARGRIDASIGRSLADRKRMSVTGIGGRDAVTHFEVLERFGVASLIALQLETGRTHQIRVHCRFAGRPVLGDPTYGVTDYGSWHIPADVRAVLERLEGQALHAERLGVDHPATGERIVFTTPPPVDFLAACEALRAFAASR
ncbi:MAG TPA: RluA family pseudouridine synthase [Candidatus Hydrogenedentes bacterium]|nr:RluA family pseudouridine synthase [Candidatus Hydrogenedentota bacterium]HPG70331.1 RluA family pseudouridine synthase [Candidatus Hydrogenedentota bacterium]